MTPRLRMYLELERLMLVMDEAGERAADALRDAMDPIWYTLSNDERRMLNERTIRSVTSLEEIRVPEENVFGPAPALSTGKALPDSPLKDWILAA